MKFLNSSYSLYRKMIVYISVLIAAILLLQSLILSRYFEQIGSRVTFDANLNILSQISYSANYLNDAVRSFAATIYSDPRNLPLLYDRTVNAEDVYAQMKEIDTMVNQSPYVYSVYLYNGVLNEFYSTDGEAITSANQFLDKDMADRLTSGNVPRDYSFSPIPRQIPLNNYRGADQLFTGVFTYLIFDRFYNSDRIQHAIVVNVKVDYLTGVINALKTKGASNTNSILIAAGDGFLKQDLQDGQSSGNDDALLRQIRESSGESGYFKHTSPDGVSQLVTYVSSDILDWKFVSITPYKEILKDMAKVRFVTYMACLVIVALGLALAFLLAKHLYSPIRYIIGKAGKQTDGNAVGNGMNDIDFLSKTFMEGIESARKLQQANNENRQLLKRQALQSLLTTEHPDSAALDKMFARHQVALAVNKPSFVCHFAIDRERQFEAAYSIEDQKLFRFMICNVAGEIMGERFRQESVQWDNGRMALLLQAREGLQEPSGDQAAELARRIQEWCLEKLNLSVTVSIGYEVPAITEIAFSFKNALDLAKYRLLDGHLAVIGSERTEHVAQSGFERPVDLEKQLGESLNVGNEDEAVELYMKMMKFVTKYTYDDTVSYLLYLSYLLYMKANEQEARGYEKLPVDFSRFTQEIMACETLEEVDAKFTELLRSMTAIVREKKFKRKNALAEKIRDILETGYTNIALCQEGVADELNVSRDYVGRIFKMTYGQTFGECLNEIRLNKASELLAHTKKNITEITEEVGWENKNYFYTMFKAKFGMTTSEYRTKYGP